MINPKYVTIRHVPDNMTVGHTCMCGKQFRSAVELGGHILANLGKAVSRPEKK